VLSLVAMTAAAMEMIWLLNATTLRPSANAVIGGVIAMGLANWAPHLSSLWHELPQLAGRPAYDPLTPVHALAWPMMTFAAVFMLTFIAQSLSFEKPGANIAAIAGTVLAVSYVGILGSFVLQMRWLDGPYHGLVPLAYLVTTAKGSDVGAYTLGRIAGRHKLWPRLSPNKTVEGAFGGLLFGIGGALIVDALARVLLRVPSLSLGRAVFYGVVVGSAAQLGDLMESMIKRDCARKDASAAVPGFGGVLDVLDSLLFAGPVAFLLWLRWGS
jgi:phosphatidate cytidylyltransferase